MMSSIPRDAVNRYKDLFSSYDDLYFLELLNLESPTRHISRDGHLDGTNLESWLQGRDADDAKEASEGLRVMSVFTPFSFTFNPQHQTASWRDDSYQHNSFSEDVNNPGDRKPGVATRLPPLQTRLNSYVAIAKTFLLPPQYLQMLRETETVFIDANNASLVGGQGQVYLSAGTRVQHFLMQNSFSSGWRFSAVLTYDAEKRFTSAFVHGLTSAERVGFVNELRGYRDDIALPTLVPSLLLVGRVAAANSKVLKAHLRIKEIERETGFRMRWARSLPSSPGGSGSGVGGVGLGFLAGDEDAAAAVAHHPPVENVFEYVNFDRVTRELTTLVSDLSYVEYLCEVHGPMYDAFNAINTRILRAAALRYSSLATAEKGPREKKGSGRSESEGGFEDGGVGGSGVKASKATKERLEKVDARLCCESSYQRASLQGSLQRARYLSKRANAHVQSIQSLLIQKENAMISRTDTTLKMMADDQKHIAFALTRDSATIRLVAAIASVFLPGIFTATFFSSTFFTFPPPSAQNVMSKHVYLFFLVTFILSVLLLITWRIHVYRLRNNLSATFHLSHYAYARSRHGSDDGASDNGSMVSTLFSRSGVEDGRRGSHQNGSSGNAGVTVREREIGGGRRGSAGARGRGTRERREK